MPFGFRTFLPWSTALVVACQQWPEVHECPAGQQEHEERCLPTPTIVFLRCVEAFRTHKVEHDKSSQLAIDATAPTGAGGPVGGSLQRAKLDRESREYTELPDDGIGIAVEECRRQEQTERESQLAAALAQAKAARAEVRDARAEAATATAKLDGLEQVAAKLREELETTTTELASTRERIAALDPCAVEAWDACAQKAVIAHEGGEHEAAARMYELACDGGHAQSCSNRGRLLEHGLGGATNLAAAFASYARGCELGSVDACVSEGVLAQRGRGTKRNPVLAARRFAKACRDDSARGCWCFADALERGLGVDADEARAAASYERACELGEAQACEDGDRLAHPIASAAGTNPSGPW